MSPSDLAAHEKREFASELKFVIDPVTAGQIKAWARQHLLADPNGREAAGDTYTVSSLYLDTPELDVFHRRGGHRHSKFRIRCYGGGAYFFERKLKVRGRLAKRRTPVTPEDIKRLAANAALGDPLLWFHHRVRHRRLEPQCQIDYRRTARVLPTPNGPIRLTLDENIQAQRISALSFVDSAGAKPVTQQVVLELKYRREVPTLFRQLVEAFALNAAPFSKYRGALPVLGVVPASAAPDAASE